MQLVIVGFGDLLHGVQGLVHHCRRTASRRSFVPVDTPIKISKYYSTQKKHFFNLSVQKGSPVSDFTHKNNKEIIIKNPLFCVKNF
jgi:hypothetical protein